MTHDIKMGDRIVALAPDPDQGGLQVCQTGIVEEELHPVNGERHYLVRLHNGSTCINAASTIQSCIDSCGHIYGI